MRGSRVVAVSAASALALGVLYLALPSMGSDLSAQVARAGFFTAHGTAPVDLRWYGGVHPWGYSLVSPPLMALLGVRLTGALTLLAAATAFAALLVRAGAPRPLLGSLIGMLTIAGNLVSGRVTYALGVAFGLAALLALTLPASAPPGRRGLRPALVVAGALLASATSPVAGLFVGLAGVALLLTRRYADGLLLGIAAALPLGVTGLLFGEGGWMNISRTDTLHAVLTSLLVAALVAHRPVRVGALLSAAGVLAAALVHTPVGLNATRLVVMFALPVLAAYARLPRRVRGRLPAGRPREGEPVDGEPVDEGRRAGAGAPRRRVAGGLALAGLLGVVCWWQPPVVAADLRGIGDPTSDRAFFDPLRAELVRRGLAGRVEVPPTRNYWEAAHLGETPLARGWLRQADIARNPLFFTSVPGATGTGVPLTPASYRAWLADNAVQYVAVPDTELSWVGRGEAELVAAGLPYLTEIWSDPHWRLYAVAEPTPLVGAPGELVRQDGASVTFRASAAGTVPVRVRHDRWLTVSGGATTAADGEWTAVTVPRAGTYTLGS
ncbi:MFS transporter [Micromonospora coerulea]|uniref:MFS transporter n=1 Tax=Micromonospora coerulea TaxID=47856 RepID=A0ABP8SGZ4_9ACTN